MWKRVKRIGLLLILGIVVVGGGALILIQTTAFQQWLLRRIQAAASEAGYPIVAERLRLDVWRLQATLENVAYDDGMTTVVKAKRAFIHVPWNIIRTQIPRITSLEIDDIAVQIRSTGPATKRSKPIEVPRIVFDKLAIRNASFSYSDDSTTVQIPSFTLEFQNGRGSVRLAAPLTVSPGLRFALPELTLQATDRSLDFGSSNWRITHADAAVVGSSRGHLQWWPAIAARVEYSTRPFSYQNWRDLESSGSITYDNGVIKLTDFQAKSAAGVVRGSAEVTDQSNSATLNWDTLNLVPLGFEGTTKGQLGVQWRAADLSDVSGKGFVAVNSRRYGRAEGDITIANARVNLAIRATAFDAYLQANITTSLDQTLSGTFQATHNQYGLARVNGSVAGTFKDPRLHAKLTATGMTYGGFGPIDASASAALTSRFLLLDDLHAQFKNSTIPQGSVRVDLANMRLTGQVPEIQLQLADAAPNVESAATLSANIEGTVSKPVVRFEGMSGSLTVGGTRIDNIKLGGEVTSEELRLNELIAQQHDGKLIASGSYNFSTDAIHAAANVSDLKIDQVSELSAIASITADIGGTLHSPMGTFTGRVIDVNYRNLEHGDIDLEGTVENNVASVRIRSDKYAADVAGDIQLQDAFKYTARLTANHSDVKYEQYELIANGAIESSGTLNPFSADQIRFDQFTAQGNMKPSPDAPDPRVVTLRATGSLAEGITISADADLSQVSVDGVQIHGQAQIEGIVSGTLKDPRIDGSLTTSDATVQAAGMTEPATIKAAIDFKRNEFKIRELHAALLGATADISGEGTLNGSGHFQFRAQDIKPERILKDRPVMGTIAVEGELEVAKPSLDGISASAKVTQLDLTVADIPIHQVEPIQVDFKDQILTARSVSVEGLVTRAVVTGSANLETRSLKFDVDGNTDLKVLEAFLPGSDPAGQMRTRIAVRGTPEKPSLEGFVTVEKMQLQLADPPVSVMDLNADIQLRGDRVQIASAAGIINGGKFTASGGSEISSAGFGNTAIQFNLEGAETEYPEGFQSEISSQLSLTGSGMNLEIAGNVDILNGIYARDINLTQEVLLRISANGAQSTLNGAVQPSTIGQIRLNVTVGTSGFVGVSNNLANFQMDGSFRLRGTIGDPVITGRASVAEGGEVYFGPQLGTATATNSTERRDQYVISEGTIDFNNPVRTEPNFDLAATREVQTKDQQFTITLRASGTPATLKTELTSDPPLDQPQIVSLLLTGRTFDELQGSELTVAQEQAANYLAGRFGNVFQTAGSAFGLSTVRVDPVLLANDEDFTAKLTIGKDLTSNFNLIYSQNLSGPRAQTWIASYKAIKDLLIRGINRSDDNNLTVELRHDLKWGGGPPLPKGTKPKDERILGDVSFEGTTVPSKDLLKEVTKTGKPFNTYRMNEDVRKLHQFFVDRDFLGARIRAVRNPLDNTVNLRFVIDEGPSITFAFEGARVSKLVQEDVRQIWIRGFSEVSSLRQSQDRLLRYLRDDGYLQAKLFARDASPSQKNRRFVFEMTPGRKFNKPGWVFRGIQPIELNVTAGTALASPKAIQDRILTSLRSEGYLNASCTEPQLVITGTEARFEISVERGPRYSVGKLTATDSEALTVVPTATAFTAAWLDRARQSIVRKYLEDGFNDVQVTAETHIPDRGTTVDINFNIEPGERQVVSKIEIEGNQTTDRSYVQRQFKFKEGDPVDYTRINLTRKNLYDTRLFRRVDLNVVKDDTGYIAKTALNEKPPWNFRYGFAVTDQLETSDRNFGATGDFTYANFLGKGITAGTSFKYTPDLREGRLFGSLPVFLGKNVTTTLATYRSRDLSEPTIITDLWGFTAQQQWQLGKQYILSYNYRYERNRTFLRNPDPNDPLGFDLTIPVSSLNGTFSRDTRDDLLNATRGTFFSNSFAIAPPGLGSSLEYIRNYTQYFRFHRVSERLVWASGFRVGGAKGFHGQELISTVQFRAGGGTTLRGFQQDKLTDAGNALFIVNQELRFPLLWRFSSVGFVDLGNVYPKIGDFNPFKLRYSPGTGIRIQTPLVLVRFDLGFNAFPKPGESRYRFSFGVGQAF